VTVVFEDGSTCVGSLLAACDGGSSRIRRALFPDQYQNYQIPVRVLGVKVLCTAKEIEPVRALDPYFLQAASSENDTFVYFSGELLVPKKKVSSLQ
jgi:2-polyprenyl-6-methoxyphenol hydroxylase-like FAD-dependent oxidoreductase